MPTRKATKEEIEAAKRDASFDLWRTYGRRLGEKGEKPKSRLFLRRFREQWTNFETISDVTEMTSWKLPGKRVDGFDEEEDEC